MGIGAQALAGASPAPCGLRSAVCVQQKILEILTLNGFVFAIEREARPLQNPKSLISFIVSPFQGEIRVRAGDFARVRPGAKQTVSRAARWVRLCKIAIRRRLQNGCGALPGRRVHIIAVSQDRFTSRGRVHAPVKAPDLRPSVCLRRGAPQTGGISRRGRLRNRALSRSARSLHLVVYCIIVEVRAMIKATSLVQRAFGFCFLAFGLNGFVHFIPAVRLGNPAR